MTNKAILLTCLLLLNFIGYSQITFEAGYFITNNDQRVNCLIKNQDWRNNPTQIRYKTTDDDDSKVVTIEEIKEFGLDNQSKYIRATVKIDRSSDELSKLTEDRNPVFETDTLLLKVLIEGAAHLYSYTDGNLRRFFFSYDDGKIEQLVYKRYLPNPNELKANNMFRQQLMLAFADQGVSVAQTQRLSYKQYDLIRFFEKLQENQADKTTNYAAKEKRDPFNLRLTASLNNSSLSIANQFNNTLNLDFGSKVNCSVGFEAEFVLPFNKGKWALTVAPEYRQLNNEKTIETSSVSQGELNASVEYKSIDLPLGLRYYFFLAPESRIFLHLAYVPNFALSSKMTFKRADGSTYSQLDVSTINNINYSVGYNYKRMNIELCYSKRDILRDYVYWHSDLKNISLKLAYQLF